MNGVLIDITGQRFNRLTVIERAHVDKKGNTYWRCICDCGQEKIARGTHVRGNIAKSCGCHKRERCKELWRKGLPVRLANSKRRKEAVAQSVAKSTPAGTLDGFTADEQAAIEAAIAAGKVTRIRQGEFLDADRLYRKRAWAYGNLRQSA